MTNSSIKYQKSIIMVLLTIIIMGQTLYRDYSEARAAEWVVFGIAIEDALLYFAGLCGITIAGAAVADGLSQTDKQKVKEAFDEGCRQAAISEQEQIAWEQQVCEGVLDKASACWKAFLDSISTSRDVVENPNVIEGATLHPISVDSYINNFTYKGYHIDSATFHELFNDVVVPESCDFAYVRASTSEKGATITFYFDEFSKYYPNSLYVDSGGWVWQGTKSKKCNPAHRCYQISIKNDEPGYSAKSSTTGQLYLPNALAGSISYSCDIYSDFDGTTPIGGTLTPSLDAFPHWKDAGVFNGDRTLSDVYNIINMDAQGEDTIVNLPWDNVTDNAGHLDRAYEKLWEKLAAGEITWEQFIQALQEGVGVISLEGVVSPDVPIEGSEAIVIEQELVPEGDVPKPKDEIYEQNKANAAYTYSLKEVFPFCIPWDIYNTVSLFVAEPEAPVFEIPFPSFKGGKFSMDNSYELDFAMFDGVALIFRVCIFILFCLGLMHATRALIRG